MPLSLAFFAAPGSSPDVLRSVPKAIPDTSRFWHTKRFFNSCVKLKSSWIFCASKIFFIGAFLSAAARPRTVTDASKMPTWTEAISTFAPVIFCKPTVKARFASGSLNIRTASTIPTTTAATAASGTRFTRPFCRFICLLKTFKRLKSFSSYSVRWIRNLAVSLSSAENCAATNSRSAGI